MSKIFRVDYYPNQAYLDFSMLSAEEIGVLIQVCNLIYMNQGPIAFDGKWISRSINGQSTAKTNRIVQQLIDKGHLTHFDDGTKEGAITKRMCEIQLDTVKERREIKQNAGSLGGKKKAENQQVFDEFSPVFEQKPSKNRAKTRQNVQKTQTENQQNQEHSSSTLLSTSTSTRDRVLPPNPLKGELGDEPKNQTRKRKGKNRNGKSNLKQQAIELMDKYRDPEPDNDDGSIL